MSDGTLVPFIDRYVGGKRSRGEINSTTARNQRLTLGTFAVSYGSRPIDRLSRADVERWMGEGNYTHASQRTRLSTVKNFTKWLLREKVIKRDPCADLRSPKQPRTVPRTFDRQSVGYLIDACPDARGRLIVLLMVQLGLRCIEVARLELGDVDEGRVVVCGKGGHQRVLPMVPEVAVALNEYMSVRGGASGPLIQSYMHPGQALARTTISLYVNEWIRAAHIKRYRYDGRSAHGLRRTCGTDMVRAGADVLDVKEALGHANVETTMKYVAYDTVKLTAAMGGRWYGDKPQREQREAG